MKVKELIEKLQEYDPDKHVYHVYDGSIFPVHEDDIVKDENGDVLFHG